MNSTVIRYPQTLSTLLRDEFFEKLRKWYEGKNLDMLRKALKKVEKTIRSELSIRLQRYFAESCDRLRKINELIRFLDLLDKVNLILRRYPDFDLRELKKSASETQHLLRERLEEEFRWFNSFRTEELKYNCFIGYAVITPRNEFGYLLREAKLELEGIRLEELRNRFEKELKKVIDECIEAAYKSHNGGWYTDFILDTNVYFSSITFWHLLLSSYELFRGKMRLLRQGELDREFRSKLPHLYSRFCITDGYVNVQQDSDLKHLGLGPGETEGLEILKQIGGNFYTSDDEVIEKAKQAVPQKADRIRWYLKFYRDFASFLYETRIDGDFCSRFYEKFHLICQDLEISVERLIKEELRASFLKELPDLFRFIESIILWKVKT
jgi:hypothetical protein